MDRGWKFLGRASFLGGVFLVAFMGIGSIFNPSLGVNNYLILALVVLGLLVGVFNIKEEETMGFLIAVVLLCLADSITVLSGDKLLVMFNVVVTDLGDIIADMLHKFVIFIVPAALVVGVSTVWKFAKNR